MIQITYPGLPAQGRLFAGPCPDPRTVAALAADGITTVASLLAAVPRDLEAAYTRAGLRLLRLPIPDFGVPTDADAFRGFLRDVLERLGAGESIYLHCHAGLGRTGTTLACLFILAGESAATAVETVRARYRPEAVETSRQRAFVEAFR